MKTASLNQGRDRVFRWIGYILLILVVVGFGVLRNRREKVVIGFDQYARAPAIWEEVAKADPSQRPRWAWRAETGEWLACPHPQLANQLITLQEAEAAVRIWREHDGGASLRRYFRFDNFYAVLWLAGGVFWALLARRRWKAETDGGFQPATGWRARAAKGMPVFMALLAVIAATGGIADIVENRACLSLLDGRIEPQVLYRVRYAAFVKWAGIIAAFASLLVAWMARPCILERLAGYWANAKRVYTASRACWFPLLSVFVLWIAGVALNQSQAILSAMLDAPSGPETFLGQSIHFWVFLGVVLLWSWVNLRTTRALLIEAQCAGEPDAVTVPASRLLILLPLTMWLLPWVVILVGLVRLPVPLRGDPQSWMIAIGLVVAAAVFTAGRLFRRREEFPVPRHLGLKAIGILSLTGALVGLTAWNPSLWIYPGPGATLALAMTLLVLVGATLVYAGDRLRLPFIALTVVLAMFCSITADSHHVRFKDSPGGFVRHGPQDAQMSLEDALVGWRRQLPPPPTGGADIPAEPLFLVATEGGGIRAAYWTAAVLGWLEDVTRAHPERFEPFSSRTFAISGVSGGSLGAAVFTALESALPIAPAPLPRPNWMRERACAFLSRDLLSPALATGVLVDSAQRVLPYPFFDYRDRAFGLERGWEDAWTRNQAEIAPDLRAPGLGEDFMTLWQQRDMSAPGFPDGPGPRWIPSLFLNGTSVEAGSRIIASDRCILPQQFPGAQDAFGLMGLRQTSHDAHTLPLQGWMPLSTAVNLSTRFPAVSPAGELRSDGGTRPQHVVDGGYYDNSGCRTAWDLLVALNHQLLRDRATADTAPGAAPPDLATRLLARPIIPWVIAIRFGEVADRSSHADAKKAAPAVVPVRMASGGQFNATMGNFMVGVWAPLSAFVNAWNMRAADATEAFKDGIYIVSRHLAGQGEKASREPEAADRSFHGDDRQPFFVELNLRDETPGDGKSGRNWRIDDPKQPSVFPLGWMLSQTACQRMDAQLHEELAPDLKAAFAKEDPAEMIRELQKKPLGRILALLCKQHPRRVPPLPPSTPPGPTAL